MPNLLIFVSPEDSRIDEVHHALDRLQLESGLDCTVIEIGGSTTEGPAEIEDRLNKFDALVLFIGKAWLPTTEDIGRAARLAAPHVQSALNSRVPIIVVKTTDADDDVAPLLAQLSLEDKALFDASSSAFDRVIAQLRQVRANVERTKLIERLLNLAQNYLKANLLDDAEKVIAKVLALDPGNAGAMQLQTTLRAGRVQGVLRQAESLISDGDAQRARELIDRSIAEFPDEQRLLDLKDLFSEMKGNAGMGTVYGPAPNPVHFSIYYPNIICPGKWHVVLAYVHLYSAVRAVRADCESRMRHEKDRPHQAKSSEAT